MPDWLIKLFGGMSTNKSAAIAFFTILTAVISWRYLAAYLTEQGLKEELVPYFILIFWFGFSLFLVEFIIFSFDFCKEKIKNKISRELSSRLALERSAKISDVLKVLPSIQVEILEGLMGGDLVLTSLSSNVYTLVDAGFIVSMHKTGPHEYVYRIDPVVRGELVKFLDKRWRDRFIQFSRSITDAQHSALNLFFCEKMPYGTSASFAKMPRDVYRALCELVSVGYLQSIPPKNRGRGGVDDKVEVFVMDEKFKVAISELGVFSGDLRNDIGVDWRFVIGSGASGGGA